MTKSKPRHLKSLWGSYVGGPGLVEGSTLGSTRKEFIKSLANRWSRTICASGLIDGRDTVHPSCLDC